MPEKSPSHERAFQDPSRPEDERIDDLISLMTLEEKVANFGTCPRIPRLGVEGTNLGEGLHGVARGGPSEWGEMHPTPTTIFPQAVGLGETWNPELIRQAAEAQSIEIRYISNSGRYGPSQLVVLAPNADLARDPRWGRIEESYGEDAFLVGRFTAAFTRGLQGDDPRYWRAASLLKHFFANTTENDRVGMSADIGERQLREYYTAGFRESARAGAACLMAAYNAVNGVPMTQNPLIKSLAAGEWGMDGIFCSDAGGMHQTVDSGHYYPGYAEATAAAIKAGINEFLEESRRHIEEALERGLLAESDLDAALRGSLRVMLRLGLLDRPGDGPTSNPYAGIGAPGEPEPWAGQAHRDLALRVTRESIVLLKNEGGLLPLDPGKGLKVAVIGPLADTVLFDWYSGTPPYAITPFQGIRDYLAREGLKRGVDPELEQNLIGAPQWVIERERNKYRGAVVRYDGKDQQVAADMAALADVAIVVVGNHPWGDAPWANVTRSSYGREAVDRESIYLEDEALVKKVRWANRNTVVVLQSSFPYAIGWTQKNVPSILHIAHCSQETGRALAEVLFGAYNPAGRTVHTWPSSQEQLLPMLDYDLAKGRTYQYFRGKPLYPFGHGLGYSPFAYGDLKPSAPGISPGTRIRVSVAIANEGSRDGDEVVQLYASYPASKLPRPRLQLVGFERVFVPAAKSAAVELPLDASALSYWDAENSRWSLEPGPVLLQVGASSADLRSSATIEALG